VTAKDLRRILRSFGCVERRQRGSHLRIECGECVTTVPVHAGEDVGPGLLASYRTRLGAVPRKGMVEEAVKSYRVAYERDESGWWVATVRGVRGCHTQGRTVDEARRRIREALELFVDDARKAPIVDDVKLPSAATRAIRAYATLRRKADEEDRRAARAARRAVRVLRTGKLKMSARDAARLLGLSHQRVHQLTQEEGNR
jgi:predicted RNase H-like HicB family nuclease/predicted RNA binding protein YcfA (HicA-like mRNA interferase family)